MVRWNPCAPIFEITEDFNGSPELFDDSDAVQPTPDVDRDGQRLVGLDRTTGRVLISQSLLDGDRDECMVLALLAMSSISLTEQANWNPPREFNDVVQRISTWLCELPDESLRSLNRGLTGTRLLIGYPELATLLHDVNTELQHRTHS